MLVLRLQRMGKTKRPSYRLIVSPKHKDTQSGQIEILGQYDPIQKTKVINLKKERIEYWLSVGAQMSPTVNNLLINAGIVKGDKKRSVFFSKKRTAKLNKAKADKKAKAEATATKTAEPKSAEPVEVESVAEVISEVKEIVQA
ncbi:MAG: 30S ribosomal protein S16 [Candidatus Magasanikbacteria bacterium RIFCSPHIGHO2_01_FULL_41_23]|nr:MAG: 30S ribosomal protein S16 [Candidatus Magasanikbacteria bacterium RIFCSPHIGHO2_01_FULL_41_23]OGH67131.1 MAG: 30S ribosomal protein S16 [Candidatus Magasanikbacteria bacterium RIFCSPHIGHO2_02_FULL_41_35]OGH76719.1 MAG: 30S ribosomal protein S16 [Candidatus Magasanikbacteria bacterium RIFCSPHIGHO2_12_FULL_41_16]